MKINKAINEAKNRVFMSPFGRRQYEVVSWSERYHAWSHSHPRDYWQARAAVREGRIAEALHLLGIEDASGEAYLLSQDHNGESWGDIVRRRVAREGGAV
jgi:hypothetical protein